MPNVVHVQTNFTSGEISPRLHGRVDLTKYNSGARLIENAVVQTHGGLTRRPGTRFCVELNADAVHEYVETIDGVATTFPCTPRLVEFHYNTEQSYVLEIGVVDATLDDGNYGYVRFNRLVNNVPTQLEDPNPGGSPTEVEDLPINAKELMQLKFTQSADTMYMFSPTRPILKLSRTGIDTASASWEFESITWTGEGTGFVDGPYLDLNSTDIALGINSDSLEVDAEGLITAYVDKTPTAAAAYPFKATDVGRLIRLEDPMTGYKIRWYYDGVNERDAAQVGLFDSPGWQFNTVLAGKKPKVEFYDVTRGPTFLDGTFHQVGKTRYHSSYSSFYLMHGRTGELEAYEGSKDFVQGRVDGMVRIVPATFSGWGYIKQLLFEDGETGNYQQAKIIVKSKFISKERTDNWRLGAWSDTTGYPQNGGFHQNRLWCAATTTQPQNLWASEVNVYNNFSPNDPETAQVIDSSALTLTLASRQVNAINHIKSDAQGLMVFTSGGEWLGRATNPSAPITPTDVGFSKQTTYGSNVGVEPIRLGTAYLMFERDKATLREYTYEFGQDRFVAPNVTILAEHITKNGIVDATFQTGANQRLWCVTNAGELLCMTYDRTQEVIGWSKCTMGATGDGVAATATVTITDFTELNTGDKVNLIATDGTNYDFVNGVQSSEAGTWESTGSNATTATNLMNVINTSSGPAGTRFTAAVDGPKVTITQAIRGADGDGIVTLTDSGTVGMTKTNFTGGLTVETAGLVKSCARTTDGDDDNVWIVVKRLIGSTEKYFIETLAQDFEVTNTHSEAFFVDSGLSGYSEDGETAWSGLEHLNGEEVYALVDGVQYGPLTVSGGAITTVSANYVQVGLRYKTIVETVPLNVQQSLESRGRRKRIFTSFLSMYRALSGKVGVPGQVYDIEYPTAALTPPPLNSGLFEISMPDNSDREMVVRYEQEDVHPANLLSITSEIHLGSI